MNIHTVELPWPDRGLFPNRSHGRRWMGLSKLRADARAIGKLCTLSQIVDWRPPKDKNIELRILFYPPDLRRRDLDGCYSALKATLDGVAEALGIDDKWFYPVTLDWEWSDVLAQGGGAVVLELKEGFG